VYGDFCVDAYWILDPKGGEISVETGLQTEAVRRHYYTLGGVDAICLTGGIGENSSDVLKVVKNDIIKLGGSKAKVLVIPTDEELMIARLTHALVKSKLGLKRRKK